MEEKKRKKRVGKKAETEHYGPGFVHCLLYSAQKDK